MQLFLHCDLGEGCRVSPGTTKMQLFLHCSYFYMGVWFRGGLPREPRNHQYAIMFALQVFLHGCVVWGGLPREPRNHQNTNIFRLQLFLHGGVV